MGTWGCGVDAAHNAADKAPIANINIIKDLFNQTLRVMLLYLNFRNCSREITLTSVNNGTGTQDVGLRSSGMSGDLKIAVLSPCSKLFVNRQCFLLRQCQKCNLADQALSLEHRGSRIPASDQQYIQSNFWLP